MEKAKTTPKPFYKSSTVFIMLWTVGVVLGWYSINFIGGIFPSDLNTWLGFGIWGMLMGVCAALCQSLALRLYRGTWSLRWAIATIVGWSLGAFAMVGVLTATNFGDNFIGGVFYDVLVIGVLIGIPSLLQLIVLRKWVRRLWLWVLSIVTSAAVISSIFSMFENNAIYGASATAFSLVGYGLVSALTLIWLFHNSPVENQTKAKHNADERLKTARTTLTDREIYPDSLAADNHLVQRRGLS